MLPSAASTISALIDAFDPTGDGEAEKSRELVRALLAHGADPLSRDNFHPGHITCTGVVISAESQRVLLVHHRRLDRWLLPGGHVEAGDDHPSATAKREVIEETGADLADATSPLVNIDVHAIPPKRGEPLHLHHDLVFGFRAQSDHFQCSEESREVVWCPVSELSRYNVPSNVARAVRRAVKTLAL